MQAIFKTVRNGLLWLIAIVVLYFAAAWAGSSIQVNGDYRAARGTVDIYVKSNGVHTDLILPIHQPSFDFFTVVDSTQFQAAASPFHYIAFGLGDKGFYLYTPTWADLTAGTAINALCWPSPTTLHITLYHSSLIKHPQLRKLSLSAAKYTELCRLILSYAQRGPAGELQLIDCCRYPGINDNFYEANARYHAFFTCNTWTNLMLKKAGCPTALWTPFEWGIMHHLPQAHCIKPDF